MHAHVHAPQPRDDLVAVGEAQGRQPEAQLLELRLAAPGQRPPRPVAVVLRQVLGREPADETGRPEQNDVVRPLGGDYVILS